MSTNFPSALDTFTNPNGSDSLNAAAVPHAEQHANANEAIEALQAKVGINGSAVATSLDYRISAAETGLDGKISSSEKGSANGVATLGFDGKVPSSQLPPLDYIPTSAKGAAGGVAGLDEAGKVPAGQLPSYVDDVLEFTNQAAFPATGDSGKIYVALDTNKTYRWSGSAYVYITSGAVDSVAGKTGVVVLAKADVGLGSVDNTSDANKPVSTATQSALDLKLNTSGGTITANSSSAALTITQTGTGNALVVEDAASDSTPFVIDGEGRVGIGETPSGKLDVAGSLGTVSINGNGDQVSFSKNGFNYLTATGASATLQIQATGASGTLTFGTNSAERMRIDSAGNVLVKSAAGLGYGAGAGGTVTQATSKSTAITLNTPCGQITMHNEALAAGASVSFDVYTNKLTAGDGVFVTPVYGPPGWDNYTLRVLHYGVGSFRLVITNISGLSCSDALIFTFQIIKGATA